MLSDGDCLSLAEQCLARIAQQCGEDLVLMRSLLGTASTLVYTIKQRTTWRRGTQFMRWQATGLSW
jgi:hypothetical protein